MYEAHWELSQRPFEPGVDARFYFPAETHQAALLKLRYAIDNRRGGALLTSAAGMGKTHLVAMLREAVGDGARPFLHLVFPQMSTADLLHYIADELSGIEVGAAAAVHHSVRRIQGFLVDNASKGRHAVIAVDEAHLVEDAETLEALRLLTNFESSGRPSLTLLLIGQTALLPTLQRLPHLEERLAVKCMLRPFSPRETADYVAHRLQVAGAKRPLLSDNALVTLHQLTHGVPRAINRLCDLALLVGYAEHRQMISSDDLEAVGEELLTVAPE